MDEPTRRRLNAINRDFYATTAADFHATRGAAWRGWERLLPHLNAPLRALDVGCGNGRFGLFLVENGRTPLDFHGVDNAPALLDYARAAFTPPPPQVEARWTVHDLVEQPLDSLPDGPYGLITLFGVMHHIPGAAQRRALVRGLAERVTPGGLLIFACWRFYEYARFRERLTSWPPDLAVEPGDHLLDWKRGTPALRYCHYVDDAEHAALVAASGLNEIDSFRADGESGDANRYSVLRR